MQKQVQEWHLVWSDEFDGITVDRSKWSFEKGFVRNNEEQFYTDRTKNVRVEAGNLIIEAHKESYQGAEYTSASIMTRYKKVFLYGRYEMRAKLPQGQGVWPAFWTTGDNYAQVGWPAAGEIDIMEYVGHSPNMIHARVHYTLNGVHVGAGASQYLQAPYDGFHTYAIEWSKERISFFVDGNNYYNYAVGNIGAFHKPHILRINFALGGSWGGVIDDSILPQQYVVDYVRVYSREQQLNVGSLPSIYWLLLMK
jgi:beta-glucanase (GH16 family)